MLINRDEVVRLRDIIKSELESLPDMNVFGGSNVESKVESHRIINDLELVLSGSEPNTDEVKSWLYGKDDYFLKDYLS